MALRAEFGRVSRRGFIPGEYETQVVQVGWVDPADPKAEELRPATLLEGEGFREYLDTAQPDRVVQINVHAGSEVARTGDPVQAGGAVPPPATNNAPEAGPQDGGGNGAEPASDAADAT